MIKIYVREKRGVVGSGITQDARCNHYAGRLVGKLAGDEFPFSLQRSNPATTPIPQPENVHSGILIGDVGTRFLRSLRWAGSLV